MNYYLHHSLTIVCFKIVVPLTHFTPSSTFFLGSTEDWTHGLKLCCVSAIIFWIVREGFTKLPKLGSNLQSPVSASQVARFTGLCCCTWFSCYYYTFNPTRGSSLLATSPTLSTSPLPLGHILSVSAIRHSPASPRFHCGDLSYSGATGTHLHGFVHIRTF